MSALPECVCGHDATMHRAQPHIGVMVTREGTLPGYLAECTAHVDGRPCGCPRYEPFISVSERLWVS